MCVYMYIYKRYKIICLNRSDSFYTSSVKFGCLLRKRQK